MCGICGWIDPRDRGGEGAAERMAELLRHRGPDDAGLEHGEGWELGFRRLSILDLSPLGHQPMRSPDGRCWLAFNGEIYNYVELRRELEQAGERFQGGSDTEVLLRLLMLRGEEALPRLNGMFALAFVDAGRRRFLLARDRLGVKPLYCMRRGGALRFASELKALRAGDDEGVEIDRDAVARYMALGYLPGEACIARDCFKLPPGHLLAGSLDDPAGARVSPYWSLSLSDDPTRRALAPAELDELESLLADAVRIRLRSDVPVGVFLSGGLDSGLVAALAARAPGRAPIALTVGFPGEPDDETALARAAAAGAGLEHRVVRQGASGLERLDALAWTFDEPFGDPSALPTYTLCEAAAGHATVFLSGDGGDEAFGGYRRYVETLRRGPLIGLAGLIAPALRGAARLAPDLSLARYRLLKLGLPDGGCAAAFDELPSDPALAHVAHPSLRPLLPGGGEALWSRWAASRGGGPTARQQRLDYGLYLPDDVLVKVDRASMAHSIEVRSPFLDVRVVEWAARLPRSALLNRREGKLPLRALGARLLPRAVERAPKRGFGVPLDAWFRTPAALRLARERLLDRRALDLGFWDARGVERVTALHEAGRGRGFGLILWRLLMLEAWARHYASDRPARREDAPAAARLPRRLAG